MSEEKKVNTSEAAEEKTEQLSLNDDRRVKTLSPNALVVKRFLRNQVAVTGLVILVVMFIFSFGGGLVSPYTQSQVFYKYEDQNKEFAGVTENTELRYQVADGATYDSTLHAMFTLASQKGEETFQGITGDATYTISYDGEDIYTIYDEAGNLIAIESKDIISGADASVTPSFEEFYAVEMAIANGESSFELNGSTYTVDEEGGISKDGADYAYCSRYVVQAIDSDVFLDRNFKEELIECIESDQETFTYTDSEGVTADYTISYRPDTKVYSILQATATKVFDKYSTPSKSHWLGTDKNGMDMLTRLMYGGRVSLYIGFLVVIIETLLGAALGGISGYFGGWIDNLIMRIVDIFYCIPSMPLIIILGAAMDQMRLDSQIRMIYLMLILGFLGWPSIARLVRGQILTLREQEFMTATEACGIRVSRRIFRHLLPNVMPQLIVTMTMSLGSTIITEATLSFLGLGVKFPFASWGNIINDVNDTYVLTHYWFIWIPAGVCLLLTVLAFNLVGDGLRDAFDPKMKR